MCTNYFFIVVIIVIVVVIRYDTAATAHWTLMFIVRAFIKYTITVAVWTSFSFHVVHHVGLVVADLIKLMILKMLR